jgi:DNA-binding transcriptional LysR family regulator
MDWRSVTFDRNRARAFLVRAEEGPFSAAGRALKLAQPGRGRQVEALAAWGQTEALEGEVAISASDADASYLLAPILARLHAT